MPEELLRGNNRLLPTEIINFLILIRLAAGSDGSNPPLKMLGI
jgi:hypothetical protein